MKHSEMVIGALIIVICFLLYEIFDLKQDMKVQASLYTTLDPIVATGGFDITEKSLGSSNSDGYWLYKNDEQKIYLFKYDPATKKIIKIEKDIND